MRPGIWSSSSLEFHLIQHNHKEIYQKKPPHQIAAGIFRDVLQVLGRRRKTRSQKSMSAIGLRLPRCLAGCPACQERRQAGLRRGHGARYSQPRFPQCPRRNRLRYQRR